MDVGARIRVALDNASLSVEQAAEKLGEEGPKKSALYDYVNGRHSPRLDDLFRLAGITGANAMWLAFGIEAPAADPGKVAEEARRALEIAALILERGEDHWNRRTAPLTEDERKIIRAFRAAPESLRAFMVAATSAIPVQQEIDPPAPNL